MAFMRMSCLGIWSHDSSFYGVVRKGGSMFSVLLRLNIITVCVLLCCTICSARDDRMQIAPDGTYVIGTPQIAPDGSYVGGRPNIAPDGSYVAGRPQIAPDGSYVGGRPQIAPDGSYVGGNPRIAPDGSYVGDGSSDW
jgi:hypothetical protein